MAEENRNLQQRMLSVMEDVAPLMKEHRNQHGKYDYVSHDQLADYIRPLLVTHGICHLFNETSYEVHDSGEVTVSMDLTLINADTPEETMTTTVWHTNQRMGGKEAGAAISYCKKYAFGLAFLLTGTGEDLEATPDAKGKPPATKKKSSPKPSNPDAKITEKQANFLWVKAKAAKIPEREVVLIIHLNGCHGPKDLTMAQFDSILKWIDKGGGLDYAMKIKDNAVSFLVNHAEKMGPPGLGDVLEDEHGPLDAMTVKHFEKAYKFVKEHVETFQEELEAATD